MKIKRMIVLASSLTAGLVGGAYLISQLSPTGRAPTPKLVSVPPPPPAPATFYRWRDEHGALQITNEKPSGVKYETVKVDGVLTGMDPVEYTSREESNGTEGKLNPLSVYTPSGMGKMVQDAKNAAQAAQRTQEQLRALSQQQ